MTNLLNIKLKQDNIIMNPNEPHLSKIAFLNLFTDRKEELIRFYRDVLGIQPLLNQDEKGTWYGFATEGLTFAIEPSSNRRAYPGRNTISVNNTLLQFKAESKDELESMNRMLEERGVKLLTRSEETHYGLITNFVDPDGNLVEILFSTP